MLFSSLTGSGMLFFSQTILIGLLNVAGIKPHVGTILVGIAAEVKTKKAIVEEDTNDTRWDVPMSMLTILAS